MKSVGIESLAVSVPDRLVTNDHWHDHYPEVVAKAEERLWMWKPPADFSEGGAEAFNREMAPYVRDPFRGVRERRYMAPDDKVVALEARAAREALAVRGQGPEDIDLLICTSFLPDAVGIGGAAFLARELGLRGAAWNLESACSSGNVAFQTACSLIATGQHRRVLVVTSCSYSRRTAEAEPIGWGIGDAATAMVVGPVPEGEGYLGGHTIHTAATCGAVTDTLELDDNGKPCFRMRAGKQAAKLLRGISEPYLKECAHEALARAGLTLDQVDHFAFNTPLAWYAAFCTRALGVDPSRTLSIYPLYSNIGPALSGMNLHHAAVWMPFRPGDVVLLYSVGSVSSCSAAVVRWGDVALGEIPAGSSLEKLRRFEAEAQARYQLERLELEVLPAVREVEEPGERLRRLVRGYVELAVEEPTAMAIFDHGEDHGREAWSREFRQRAESFLKAFEGEVASARAQPREPRVDPKAAALSLLGIVHWAVRSHRAEERLSGGEAVEQITRLALHGLTVSGEPKPGLKVFPAAAAGAALA